MGLKKDKKVLSTDTLLIQLLGLRHRQNNKPVIRARAFNDNEQKNGVSRKKQIMFTKVRKTLECAPFG